MPGEPCVSEQLHELVPADANGRMLAVDGDCIRHVKRSLEQVPEDTSHLFVSVGRNDALEHYETLLGTIMSREICSCFRTKFELGFAFSIAACLRLFSG